jgi:hypothetical protein
MKKSYIKRPVGTVAVIIAVMLLITSTALAARYFLKPGEVAEKIGNHTLSAAFESDTAMNINASKTSGGYIYTLLAVVTGKDLTDTPYYSDGVSDDSTYAVVAIENTDGTPFTTDYEQTFFASPLVKGQAPWRLNAFFLHGSGSEIIVDGVIYRIAECNNVTMFADRGLYFAVADVMTFDNRTFLFDEVSGEISFNPDYEGASAIFDLPIDKSLADPEKAEIFLNGLA